MLLAQIAKLLSRKALPVSVPYCSLSQHGIQLIVEPFSCNKKEDRYRGGVGEF